jgi:hypothetical protein
LVIVGGARRARRSTPTSVERLGRWDNRYARGGPLKELSGEKGRAQSRGSRSVRASGREFSDQRVPCWRRVAMAAASLHAS